MTTDTAPNTTDTEPGKVDPSTLDDYEPDVPGETPKEKRARKARNRRRAERVQREAAAAASTSSAPVGRPSKQSKRAAAVTGIVTGVGIGVLAFDEHDGTVIVEGAPALGDALAKVAEKNAKVAKALDALTETSAWAEVAMAVGAIVVPIARHHGMTPATLRRPEPEPRAGARPPTTPAPAATTTDGNPPTLAPEARPQVRDDAPAFTTRQTPPAADVPTFTTRGN